MRFLIVIVLVFSFGRGPAQILPNKYGHTWVSGNNGGIIKFSSDTSMPNFSHYVFNELVQPNTGDLVFINNSSSISDPITGELLFYTNGRHVYDKSNNKMMGSDMMKDSIFANSSAGYLFRQIDIILPIDSYRYYLVYPYYSNTAYNNFFIENLAYSDILAYSIIDMRGNNGKGQMIVCNKKVTTNARMRVSGMHATKHANGKDWWLVKQGKAALGTRHNYLYRYLIKADTIEGPFLQNLDSADNAAPETAYAQMNFSEDGSKIIFGNGSDFSLGDFDRCTGLVSNSKFIKHPRGHTYQYAGDSNIYYINPADTIAGVADSLFNGVGISPNNRFAYISTDARIYQYDTWEPDSTLRWYTIINGPDTCCPNTPAEYWMQALSNIMQGPDGRLYVGAGGAPSHAWQVIHKPNLKGAMCQFQVKGFRPDTGALYFGMYNYQIVNVPNMPNYNLGPLPNQAICWPTTISNTTLPQGISYWPNPTHGLLNITYTYTPHALPYTLYNTMGMQVQQGMLQPTITNTININGLAIGLYYLKAGSGSYKVVVE
jgi:hypothetical protein